MAGFGQAAAERAAIEATYEDTMDLFRPGNQKIGSITKTVLVEVGVNIICAYSQSGGGGGTQTDTMNRLEYDATVFASPELVVLPGDTIKLRRFGRIDPGSTVILDFEPVGEPPKYATHQEILVKVRKKA